MTNRQLLFSATPLLVGIGLAASVALAPAQPTDFHAIVEPDGKVVLCVSAGQILFADRCEGTGRLTIVQPMQEGPVVWRTAFGSVVMENESPQNPACALSRAKWDRTSERAIPSGKTIKRVVPNLVRRHIDTTLPGMELITDEDIAGFKLDLDNEGEDETIFVADSVPRVSKLNEKTGQAYRYVMYGGVLQFQSPIPAIFYHEGGEYVGGTDAIGQVALKGIVPMASGEIGVRVKTGTGYDGIQTLLRYRRGTVQRIETIEFTCL